MKTKLLMGVGLMVVAAAGLRAEKAAPPAEGSLVQIHNRAFGELLRPRNASKKDGAPIVLYPAQPWKCVTWRVQHQPDGGVVLENQFSLKTLAPAKSAEGKTAVEQVPLLAAGAPQWRWEALPDGAWKISVPEGGGVLTAEKTSDGLRVIVAPWTGADAQQWELRPAPELTM